MIIFGTRGVSSTINQGQFNCPQCEITRPFQHKKVTKFFTLYFIPLIPLGSAGEYVECRTCKGTFIPKVLDFRPGSDPGDFQSEYEKAMKHCMVHIMMADGEMDESELQMVQQIINKFGHNDMSLDELRDYVEEFQKNPEDITSYLRRISPSLNEHGKEIIIKCALSVAASDGKIEDSEIVLIEKMAKTMEMSSAHLRGIFSDMAEEKTTKASQN